MNILSNFFNFVKTILGQLQKHLRFILLLLIAFGLGFAWGAKIFKRPPILISGNVVDLNSLFSATSSQSENYHSFTTEKAQPQYYVASSRGKYYYPDNCSLAKTLSPKNLLKFNTAKEAEDAGYILNSHCQ